MAREVRGPRPSAGRARAPVRRPPRRRQDRGKIDTLENLLPRLDLLLLGGGMANTFLAAQGYELGGVPLRAGPARTWRARSWRARRPSGIGGPPARRPGGDRRPRRTRSGSRPCPRDRVPAGMKAVDVGPETRKAFAAAVGRARTLFWNGPLGVFEKPPFDAGTREVAQALASCPRLLGDRRRRDRGRRKPGRGRRPHRPRLHRRRRLARVPGRQDPARRGGAGERARVSPAGRRPLIAANWKMNLLQAEAAELLPRRCASGLAARRTAAEVVLVFPSFPADPGGGPRAGGQRGRRRRPGPPPRGQGRAHRRRLRRQLADAGCSWVLCGHSERRRDHGEDDELVGRKVAAAARHDLTPHDLPRRDARRAPGRARPSTVLERQLADRPGGRPRAASPWPTSRCGRSAPARRRRRRSPRRPTASCAAFCAEGLGEAAADVPILYGGSVTPDNAAG